MTVARTSADGLFAVAAACWGFLESESLDGWELRAGDGFTNRANSAWPLGPLRRPLPEALDEVRACGAGHDGALRQTAPLAPALEILAAQQHPNVPVSTAERPQDRWLRLYRAGTVPPRAKQILGSGDRYHYATIYDEYSGEPLSIGRAVLAGESGSWVGLAAIETDPAARRRGLGRLILGTLLEWAADQGAEQAMLEVFPHNEPAISLYRQLGFTTAQEYHYRVVPTEAQA